MGCGAFDSFHHNELKSERDATMTPAAERMTVTPGPATSASSATPHRFIVVEGPIGVGKTSLARRLGMSLSAELVLEQASENPFLERFYRNPRASAFPTQLYFLFQRAQQLAALKQQDLFAPIRVADYLLEKDRLFAKVTLEEAEYALYEQVSAKLAIEPPKPDLVIYLQAPVDVLLERIARRGIGYEQQIGRDYLERLNEAYARFFHEYESAPLLIVNAASIDPVNNQSDYDELIAAVNRMRRGRLYYNPLRHASF
jgi:deoxyguanosine kinase